MRMREWKARIELLVSRNCEKIRRNGEIHRSTFFTKRILLDTFSFFTCITCDRDVKRADFCQKLKKGKISWRDAESELKQEAIQTRESK